MSGRSFVDERLNIIYGHRARRLNRGDLPTLALAISAFQRGQATVRNGYSGTLGYVYLAGDGFDILVLADDWNQVVPFLRDGTFNPEIVATPAIGVADPNEYYATPFLAANDPLYRRVYDTLYPLFPDAYPTSNL